MFWPPPPCFIINTASKSKGQFSKIFFVFSRFIFKECFNIWLKCICSLTHFRLKRMSFCTEFTKYVNYAILIKTDFFQNFLCSSDFFFFFLHIRKIVEHLFNRVYYLDFLSFESKDGFNNFLVHRTEKKNVMWKCAIPMYLLFIRLSPSSSLNPI